MEDTDLKAPILGASRNGTGGGRLSRRSYSVKSLKKDFALSLPDKLRSAGDFDPESQTFSPDLSTISGLTKGLSLSLSLCLTVWFINKMQEKNKKKMVYVWICVYNLYIAQKRTHDRTKFTHCY